MSTEKNFSRSINLSWNFKIIGKTEAEPCVPI